MQVVSVFASFWFFAAYSGHTDSLLKCCSYCVVTVTPVPPVSPRQGSIAGTDPVSCRICKEAIGKLSCARVSLHGPIWEGEGVFAQVVHKKRKETSTSRDECQGTWTYSPWETRKPWKMHLWSCETNDDVAKSYSWCVQKEAASAELLGLQHKSHLWLHSRLRSQNKLWL